MSAEPIKVEGIMEINVDILQQAFLMYKHYYDSKIILNQYLKKLFNLQKYDEGDRINGFTYFDFGNYETTTHNYLKIDFEGEINNYMTWSELMSHFGTNDNVDKQFFRKHKNDCKLWLGINHECTCCNNALKCFAKVCHQVKSPSDVIIQKYQVTDDNAPWDYAQYKEQYIINKKQFKLFLSI